MASSRRSTIPGQNNIYIYENAIQNWTDKQILYKASEEMMPYQTRQMVKKLAKDGRGGPAAGGRGVEDTLRQRQWNVYWEQGKVEEEIRNRKGREKEASCREKTRGYNWGLGRGKGGRG